MTDDIKRLEAKIDAIARHLGIGAKGNGGSAPASTMGDITPASDAQLDDPTHGDPLVKNDPKRWKGPSEAGRTMSQCSPQFLRCLAEQHAWRAGKAIEEGKDPKWARLDAARALGWAARNERSGPRPAPASSFGDPAWDGTGREPGDDSMPF